ncbi:MAG: Cell wall hydrolase [Candidatus Tokpelaia hoelldobleri]|uniref:Cell wall hydrolase n=1 Tax=Candidatus Tokpelaia hoelldobleri TaxID=1902579 RepID=A0A1U9JW36_9HYPH|nr:MAG: Cell wall hydrolase [Candidatus Tokpelaia hoelldoblerii]
MVRLLSSRRVASRTSHDFACKRAASYHLPEGRYYEAPLVLKPERRNHALPLLLGLGLSCMAASSLQTQDAISGLVVNSTQIIIHGKSGHVTVVSDRMDTGGQPVQDSFITASLDEERINRPAKTTALQRSGQKSLPLFAMAEEKRSGPYEVAFPIGTGKNHGTVTALALSHKKNADIYKGHTVVAQLVAPQRYAPQPAKVPVPALLASVIAREKADVPALAYAPVEAALGRQTPFDSILREDKPAKRRFIPPIGKEDHAWAAAPLPASAFSAREQKCLAEAVYFEARGESLKGQAAVAQVVLNRVRNPAYPATVCGVVYQNVKWRNRCQFSFACDGKRHRVNEIRQWHTAQDIAKAVSNGQIWQAEVGSSTHYHAVYVKPRWSRTMVKTQKIGQHIFYRTRGGGWI